MGAIEVTGRLVWHFSKTGQFFVKKCYHLIQSTTTSEVNGAGSDLGQGSGLQSINWGTLWEMKVPPKVRIFFWRVILNILPTES